MIDARALAGLLPSRRWFGGKSRAIERVDLLDEATLEDGSPPLVFCIAAVLFEDGASHMYNLPLLVDPGGAPRDVFEDVERMAILGQLMTHGETIKGSTGVFHFGGPGLDPRSPPGASVRAVGAEQTNSSVILDDSVIVKLFRRVEKGPNPDLELSRLLTNEGFENIPAHVGEIVYEGELGGEEIEIDLGLAQHYVAEGREGWSETLAHVRTLLDQVDVSGEASDDEREAAVAELGARSLDDLARLGEVIASLHVVLAREELEPDVVAEPMTEHDVTALMQRVRGALQRLLADGVAELAPNRDGIEARLDALAALDDVGCKTRVHGDLHLGQVLLAPRGWTILDFEGEPARSFEERRAKRSPLLDVAGMLRSFSYATCAVLFERAAPGTGDWDRVQPWAGEWESQARERFLHEYLRTSHEGGFLPADRAAQATLLDVFEIDKALYEISYERSHRPEWLRIPLTGIQQLLARSAKR